MRKLIGSLLAATALVAVMALPAGAGEGNFSPLHIDKVVVGPVPAGTQFVVTVECEGRRGEPIIANPGGGANLESVQFVFDAQGNAVGAGGTVTFNQGGSCVVTETQTGGAASVSYQCEGTLPPPTAMLGESGRFSPRPAQNGDAEICPSSGPQSEPIGVNIIARDQEATVTVTNTFVDPGTPEPAAAVVEVPAFTG